MQQNEDWALGLSAKALGKHQAVIESDEDEESDEDGRRKKRRRKKRQSLRRFTLLGMRMMIVMRVMGAWQLMVVSVKFLQSVSTSLDISFSTFLTLPPSIPPPLLFFWTLYLLSCIM